jgi:hypothetical protein
MPLNLRGKINRFELIIEYLRIHELSFGLQGSGFDGGSKRMWILFIGNGTLWK